MHANQDPIAPRTYISCAPADQKIARDIAANLRALKIAVWEPCENHPSTTSDDAARTCDCAIVLLTRNYSESQGCIAEALGLHECGRNVVIAIWDDTPLPEILDPPYCYEKQVVLSHFSGEGPFMRELARAVTMKFCRGLEVDDAYEGTLEYAFVSYSHLDAYRVFKMIGHMQRSGFRIWYDSGIQVGTEWDGYIADHINRSSCFIFFATELSMSSSYCLKEIERAKEKGIPFVVAYLDESPIPEVLDDLVKDNQNIYRNVHPTDEALIDKLVQADALQYCKDMFDIGDPRRQRFCMLGSHRTHASGMLVKYIGGSQRPKLPDGVRGIADAAFVAPNAKRIVVPHGVRHIGDSAFAGCGLLEHIELPETVESIGSRAFMRCFSLQSIVIPASVRVIESETFSGCISLKSVTWLSDENGTQARRVHAKNGRQEGGRIIRERAFGDCTSLERFSTPSDVTRIEPLAFSGCARLNVTFASHDISICDIEGTELKAADYDTPGFLLRNGLLFDVEGRTLISGKVDLVENVFIPEGVQEIGEEAFLQHQPGTVFISSISLPSTLTRIRARAFANAPFKPRMAVVLPDSVTQIEEGAFSCCHVVQILIPWSVRSIGRGAFFQCARVEVEAFNEHFASKDNFLTDKEGKVVLSIPNDPLREIEGVTTIADCAFSDGMEGCHGSFISQATATTVRIPRSLTCLSQKAGNVILPNGVSGNVRDDRDGVLAAWRECREDVTIRAVTDDELRAMGIPV